MTWKNGEYQPKQQRANEKKTLVLDAALKLFGTKGYHSINAKTIAAEAGVATGTFYRCFRDKKAVFMAVCHRSEKQIGGQVFDIGRQMRAEEKSEQEILDKLVHFAITAHRENKGFHREVLAMQISDPDVAAWGREREERQLLALREFLQIKAEEYHVDDLEAAAELIYYTIEETAHRAILFDNPVGEERLINALRQMLHRYLF